VRGRDGKLILKFHHDETSQDSCGVFGVGHQVRLTQNLPILAFTSDDSAAKNPPRTRHSGNFVKTKEIANKIVSLPIAKSTSQAESKIKPATCDSGAVIARLAS
jgi:hypothetical protein